MDCDCDDDYGDHHSQFIRAFRYFTSLIHNRNDRNYQFRVLNSYTIRQREKEEGLKLANI